MVKRTTTPSRKTAAAEDFGDVITRKLESLAGAAKASLNKARTRVTKKGAAVERDIEAAVKKAETRLKKAGVKARKSVEAAVPTA